MGRHRRARSAGQADRYAADLAGRLGAALKNARRAQRWTQHRAARRAGITQSTWSRLETERDASYTLGTWVRATFAVGGRLDAFVRGASAADLPRDAVHLRAQELIITTALGGRWQGLPEELIDREARTSRAGDALLWRRLVPAQAEYALMEVIDWFSDVGQPLRDWSRRLDALERYAISRMRPDDELPRTSGCWVVRATQRNRQLVSGHRNLFRSRFPGSSRAWLAALADPDVPMPDKPALIWISVAGDRLFEARLG